MARQRPAKRNLVRWSGKLILGTNLVMIAWKLTAS